MLSYSCSGQLCCKWTAASTLLQVVSKLVWPGGQGDVLWAADHYSLLYNIENTAVSRDNSKKMLVTVCFHWQKKALCPWRLYLYPVMSKSMSLHKYAPVKYTSTFSCHNGSARIFQWGGFHRKERGFSYNRDAVILRWKSLLSCPRESWRKFHGIALCNILVCLQQEEEIKTNGKRHFFLHQNGILLRTRILRLY